MSTREGLKTPTLRSLKFNSSSLEFQLHVCGVPFTLNRELLASKSAKFAQLLKENPHRNDISNLLPDIPADPETFELVARFCHGYEITLTPENVVAVSCLANYLGMTENHRKNNLLAKSIVYFELNVIPDWNKCVKALKAMEKNLQQSVNIGLVNVCVESIVKKAVEDPRILGEPIKILAEESDDEENGNGNIIYPENVRRKLFALDWKQPEDLTGLSLILYEPIMRTMITKIPPEYVTASLSKYAEKWVFSSGEGEKSRREIIEAVERLLPHERGYVPCTLLFSLLGFAVGLNACEECRAGLELRIGKQLDQACVNDLLIPSKGYAKDEKYDTECVRRILKNFYSNYNHEDLSGLITVAELIDEFLAEVATDIDLKLTSFISLADMSVAASAGTGRNADGIYRAVDIYLEKHKYLTESEKEEVCKALDCNKMSVAACAHAATNDRLPLRLVVQVLFVAQLQLRDKVGVKLEQPGGETEKMENKVMDLERECYNLRTELEKGNCCGGNKSKKVGKTSMWKEMKRKFGCGTSSRWPGDCNCHVKKKKKTNN